MAIGDRLHRADEVLSVSASRILRGEMDADKAPCRKAALLRMECRRALTNVPPFFVRGWHGGLRRKQSRAAAAQPPYFAAQ